MTQVLNEILAAYLADEPEPPPYEPQWMRYQPSPDYAKRTERTIIEITVLTMFHSRKDLPLGGPVALQLIRDEHPRHVGQAFEQFAEELLRRPLVAPALQQDVEHLALLIYRPPQIMVFALDGEKHLIEMPFVTGPGASATQLIGIVLPKLVAPFADGFIRHDGIVKLMDHDLTVPQYIVIMTSSEHSISY